MIAPVDVLAVIRRQKEAKASLRIFPPAARKPRKVVKESDIDAAVNATLYDLDREFRRLGVAFPRQRKAFDVARATVQHMRRPSR